MEALQAGPVRFELAARHEWQRIETVLNHTVTHNSLSVSCGRNFVFGLRTVF
jgi:iron complex outermembrane receptor protein